MDAGLRNDFAKKMTSAQITEAQQRVREWKPLKSTRHDLPMDLYDTNTPHHTSDAE